MNPAGNIAEILHHKGGTIWSVAPNATVFEAIELMANKNVGALLVMEGEKLVGIISERDYTRKVALKGKSSKETKVREIMGTPVITVPPQQPVSDCLRLMTEHRVRHLPVVEGARVIGVISIGDLVNWIISTQSAEIQQLEQYIAGGVVA